MINGKEAKVLRDATTVRYCATQSSKSIFLAVVDADNTMVLDAFEEESAQLCYLISDRTTVLLQLTFSFRYEVGVGAIEGKYKKAVGSVQLRQAGLRPATRGGFRPTLPSAERFRFDMMGITVQAAQRVSTKYDVEGVPLLEVSDRR